MVLNEIRRSEYAIFGSTGMAGAVSGRRFKVVAYAELGSVVIAEEEVGDTMTSS